MGKPEEGEIEAFNSMPYTQDLENQRAKNRLELIHCIVTHALAYIMVIPFMGVIIYDLIAKPTEDVAIPVYLISLVSTVIGFYFGGRLRKEN